MIEYTTGDILRADVEALVNTVNCVGVMGRGIALQFKTAFPDNFKVYEAACAREEVQPGHMFVYDTGAFANPRYIINFPTKRHWRGKSRIEDIDAGLKSLVQEVRQRGITSLAIPPLGSGLGGLRWALVRTRIERALADVSGVRVIVFEPHGATRERATVSAKKVPKMTPGRAALVGLMDRYLTGLLDPFVSLLEVHKLLYFMQEAGEPLRLHYVKALYGPYAENLGHVLRAVEGQYVTGYFDGGDSPDKPLQLVPGAVRDAEALLEANRSTRTRFDRVADLVEGFETAFGLELLSTVHWVAAREGARTPSQAVAKTRAWGPRKARFSDSQIHLAFGRLQRNRWLDHAADPAGA